MRTKKADGVISLL